MQASGVSLKFLKWFWFFLIQFQVYEAQIEDKGKTFVFLRLSADCVSELNLTCDEEFHAQVLCKAHALSQFTFKCTCILALLHVYAVSVLVSVFSPYLFPPPLPTPSPTKPTFAGKEIF